MSVGNLILAAVNGNLAEVQRLVQNGVDINGLGSHLWEASWTALMCACASNRVNVAIFLADHPRINLNVQDNSGLTALIYAAANNSVDCAKHLLTKAEIQVNLQSNDGYTALHYCSANNHLATATLLLEHPKIDVTIRNNNGRTALDVAVQKNGTEVSRLIQDYIDGSFETTDLSTQQVELFQACKDGNLDSARQLLRTVPELNVNVTCRSKQHSRNGYTALHWCSEKNRTDIAELLVEHPAIDVSIQSTAGQTALDVAVKQNHHKINSLIMEKINDDFDPTDLSPEEAQLLEACKNGDLQHLQQLLRTMPNLEVNVTCASNQYHALHFACKHGHHLVVKELCKHPHISLNGSDNKGKTPLHWASQRNHFQCLQALMRHRDIDYHLLNNESKSALEVAQENSEVKKYLMQETKMTPVQKKFFAAAQAGRSSDVENLLRNSHIPDVNLQHPITQMTALHYACRYGHMRLLRFLLKHQSLNLGVQDEHGQTALHEACRWPDNEDLVAELLDKMSDAQASIQDGDGCTAFQVALAMENTAAMTEFLECENFEAHQALLQACTHPTPKVNMHKEFLKNFMMDFIARLHKHGLVDSNAKDHLGSSITDHVLAMLNDDAASKACLQKVLQAADTKNSPDNVLQ